LSSITAPDLVQNVARHWCAHIPRESGSPPARVPAEGRWYEQLHDLKTQKNG